MKEKVVRILHLSDCLIGSTDADVLGVFQSLKKDLDVRYDLRGQIDYIAVCGNITADHSEGSFNLAASLLRDLADTLLRRDDGKVRLNRFLLVPGPRDFSETTGSANFKMFHDDFFKEEIVQRRMEEFDPDAVMFRDMKDLTFMGLCHWKDARSACAGTTLEKLGHLLEKTTERVLPLEYTYRTPTLLLSAGNILFNGEESAWPAFKKIQALLAEYFKTTIHLFGASDVSGIFPSPLFFNHVGLGTSIRNKEGFWPLSLNLIEFTKEALNAGEKVGRGVYFRNDTYQRISPNGSLDKYPWVNGQLDSFFKKERAHADLFFRSCLGDLEKELKSNNFIVIKGFPGVGKRAFFEYLQKRDRLVEQKIKIIPISAHDYYKDEASFATLWQKIHDAVSEVERPMLGPDVMVLLVIHDTQFLGLPHQEKGQALDKFLSENHHNFIRGNVDALIYLTNNWDFTRGDDPDEGRKTKALPLQSLDHDEVEQLVVKYSCCAPAEIAHLNYLTGGYAGFSELLLNAAKNEFENNISGAEPICKETPTKLLCEALQSEALRDESRWHLNCIQLLYGGTDLCRYIEGKVEPMRRQGISDFSCTPHVEISLMELKQSIHDPVKRENIDKMLKYLDDIGILSNNGAPDLYRLRVVAPFLVRGESRIMMERKDEGWPAISKADIEGSADFVIITALNEEREAVLRKLRRRQVIIPSGKDALVYHYSKLPFRRPDGQKGVYRLAVVSLADMGHTEAAIAATHALDRWNPAAVIMVGIAGGVGANSVKIGDILIARSVLSPALKKVVAEGSQSRWDGNRIDATLFNVANNLSVDTCLHLIDAERPSEGVPGIHYGPMSSDNIVIADERVLNEYRDVIPKLIGVEMEAWGVALAAFQRSEPKRFFMVRGVSDLADAQQTSPDVKAWRLYACDVAASYAVALLRQGPLRLSDDAAN